MSTREQNIERLSSTLFDVLIVGGGINWSHCDYFNKSITRQLSVLTRLGMISIF